MLTIKKRFGVFVGEALNHNEIYALRNAYVINIRFPYKTCALIQVRSINSRDSNAPLDSLYFTIE